MAGRKTVLVPLLAVGVVIATPRLPATGIRQPAEILQGRYRLEVFTTDPSSDPNARPVLEGVLVLLTNSYEWGPVPQGLVANELGHVDIQRPHEATNGCVALDRRIMGDEDDTVKTIGLVSWKTTAPDQVTFSIGRSPDVTDVVILSLRSREGAGTWTRYWIADGKRQLEGRRSLKATREGVAANEQCDAIWRDR